MNKFFYSFYCINAKIESIYIFFLARGWSIGEERNSRNRIKQFITENCGNKSGARDPKNR